jgi:hypothetical protein
MPSELSPAWPVEDCGPGDGMLGVAESPEAPERLGATVSLDREQSSIRLPPAERRASDSRPLLVMDDHRTVRACPCPEVSHWTPGHAWLAREATEIAERVAEATWPGAATGGALGGSGAAFPRGPVAGFPPFSEAAERPHAPGSVQFMNPVQSIL